MGKRGFVFDLLDNLDNNTNIHKELIQTVEDKFLKRNLIFYIAHFGHPQGIIQDFDVLILENILRSMDLNKFNNQIDFVIDSPGGLPYSAEKIVKLLKSYGNFRAIVINQAMSAATLLCLGASDLWKELWHIYNRIFFYLNKKNIAKYVCCRNGGIDINITPKKT